MGGFGQLIPLTDDGDRFDWGVDTNRSDRIRGLQGQVHLSTETGRHVDVTRVHSEERQSQRREFEREDIWLEGLQDGIDSMDARRMVVDDPEEKNSPQPVCPVEAPDMPGLQPWIHL